MPTDVSGFSGIKKQAEFFKDFADCYAKVSVEVKDVADVEAKCKIVTDLVADQMKDVEFGLDLNLGNVIAGVVKELMSIGGDDPTLSSSSIIKMLLEYQTKALGNVKSTAEMVFTPLPKGD